MPFSVPKFLCPFDIQELQNYPEIGFDWKEPGIAFRVTLTNTNYQ